MRLIDADALEEELEKDIMGGLNYRRYIRNAPTVCDIEKIRQEFKNEAEMYKLIDRQMANVWSEALKIINKYKGDKE